MPVRAEHRPGKQVVLPRAGLGQGRWRYRVLTEGDTRTRSRLPADKDRFYRTPARPSLAWPKVLSPIEPWPAGLLSTDEDRANHLTVRHPE